MAGLEPRRPRLYRLRTVGAERADEVVGDVSGEGLAREGIVLGVEDDAQGEGTSRACYVQATCVTAQEGEEDPSGRHICWPLNSLKMPGVRRGRIDKSIKVLE